MPKLFHITLVPGPDVTHEQIDQKMNLAIDWIRYTTNCWLVWSSSDVQRWKERLGRFAKPSGHLLIIKVDPRDYGGFANKQLWPWLAGYKAQYSE